MSIVFRSVREAPFLIDGLYRPELPGNFRRIPQEVADLVSPGVARLSKNTAGGRVRFSTNADRIVLRSDVVANRMSNMMLIGSSGFDLYSIELGEEHFAHSFRDKDSTECFAVGVERSLPGKRMYDYVLYFPLYTSLTTLEIGLPEEAELAAPEYTYTISEPIVYYGSSITQGASASRPGLSYEAIISRRLHAQFLNLGFAGNARAEDEMIRYLAGIPSMSAFVCDYDHNAPNVDHLRNTHSRLYRAVREAHSDIPIILVSAPITTITNETWIRRRAIILQTYLDGIAAGDFNLHLVDGFTMMMGDATEDTNVDGTHPNDLGLSRMAYAIGNTLSYVIRMKNRKAAKE